jgi:hypothetical protein
MKSKEIPDFYQVKFSRLPGYVIYGVVDRFSLEARKKYKEQKTLLVSDAILPKRYWILESKVTPIHDSEYPEHVQAEYLKAHKLSDSVKGFGIGKLFSIGVADGLAYYVVTKLDSEKGLALVEWRGFCLDRYTDHWLGWGEWVPISKVKPLCKEWPIFLRKDNTNGRNKA